jgi:hypothetical protein
MLNFRIPEIVLGALLATAVFALIAGLYSRGNVPETNAPNAKTEQQSHGASEKQKAATDLNETSYNVVLRIEQIIAQSLQNTANYCANNSETRKINGSKIFCAA